MRNKRVFVTGMAGSGKSTLGELLAKHSYRVIDIDHVPNLCGWVNNETQERVYVDEVDNDFMNEHEYKCDMGLLTQMMEESDSPVFVLGCVGDNSDFWPLFDAHILLQCSPETMVHRLQTRDTNPFGRDPEVQERILDWKKKFDAIMIENGAMTINTEQPVDQVAESVITKLQ